MLRFISVFGALYLPPVELSDEQIKALIINYLMRRRCWGKKYQNRQKVVRYLGQEVLGNGNEVSRCLDELIDKGWINSMKKGKTISLNVSAKKSIMQHIEEYSTNDL